jgi:hypothetical protein
VARCTGRLTGPGKHAHPGALLGAEQRVKCLGLGWCQATGELVGNVPFGQHQCDRDEALDDEWAGHDDSPSAQLLHEGLRNGGGTRGGQRHWQQPSQDLAPLGQAQLGEAEHLAQGIELLVAGLVQRG